MEDIRYDMVSEVDFSARLIDSNVRICTPNKDLRFRSFSGAVLRKMTAYIQNRIMEFRQQHMMQQPYDGAPFQQQVETPAPAQQQPASPSPSRHYLQTSTPPQPQQALTPPQPAQVTANPVNSFKAVSSLPHQVINPYLKVPLMMRRRVSRFPSV
jgi:hypothetical protein